eukprot:TRINITY_DN12761_c0_g1_i1.p1 TRINITY_DN12761_c0_g1~~TRINITY_DN12761_c0_g1_i1.p1  ORF type:complete len:215 (-),score=41.37 TRINITY_DN12761_c0_g1_i1:184-828(-)
MEDDLTRRLIGKEAAIIYCIKRDDCNKIASHLREKLKIEALSYHAGMSDKMRQQVHEKFIRDDVQCIVATVAFGMGIDKPDIRTIIHYGPTKSLEAYYQQTGRAGRDGMPSKCILFHSASDFSTLRYVMSMGSRSNEKEKIMLGHMEGYIQENSICRRIIILRYFGEEIQDLASNCRNCDNCSTERQKRDFTSEARKVALAVYETGENLELGSH